MGIFAKIAADEAEKAVEAVTEAAEEPGFWSKTKDAIGTGYGKVKGVLGKGYGKVKEWGSKGYGHAKDFGRAGWTKVKNNKILSALAALSLAGNVAGGRYYLKNRDK